jgi:hypothetical protein
MRGSGSLPNSGGEAVLSVLMAGGSTANAVVIGATVGCADADAVRPIETQTNPPSTPRIPDRPPCGAAVVGQRLSWNAIAPRPFGPQADDVVLMDEACPDPAAQTIANNKRQAMCDRNILGLGSLLELT